MGLFGIVLKEFKHILRDYRTLLILFLLPLLQMILFGHAMSMDVKNISIKIIDYDDSPVSRELVRGFNGSGYFSLYSGKGDDPNTLFQRRMINAILTIPNGFAGDITAGTGAPLDLVIDGSDSNRALIIHQYIAAALVRTASLLRGEAELPVKITPVFKYNSELNSAFFFVPGLVALIIIMVSALLTSLTIAREKEQGTFDLIKISPVHAYQVIIGKVIPYLLLSLIIGIFVIICGMVFFGVPVRGSYFSLLLYHLIYCLTGLSFGILISTMVSSQLSAMLIAMIATLLPTLFLSGFIFQLEAMPGPLRLLSWMIPAKYFLVIIRGLMLKGNTQRELVFYITMLLFFSALFLVIAIRRFKAYLED